MKKLLPLGVGCILSIGLLISVELFLRWEEKRNQPIESRACRRFSPELHHELIPKTICRSRYSEWNTTFSVNELGFRDQEVADPKPPDEFRVLLLGDSFIEGESVEVYETSSWRLEQELQKEMNRPVDVINMGVMSYSAIQYERLLKKWVDQLQPDFVIVAVDMSDFQNDYSYSFDLDEEGQFRNILFQQQMGVPHVALPGVSGQLKFWLRTHSVLYATMADRTKQLVRKAFSIPEPTVFLINDPKSDPHYVTRSEENARDPLMWEQFGSSMRSINTLFNVKKIPWVAVIYPYGHQAAPDEWAVGREKNGFERGIVYPSTSQALLFQYGNYYGFHVTSLVPAFQQAAKESEQHLFWPYDGHFTPKGHEVLAEELVSVILEPSSFKERAGR